VEGGLESKLEHYGTSNAFGRIERTSNYSPSSYIEDFIMDNYMGEGKKKVKILHCAIKLTNCGRYPCTTYILVQNLDTWQSLKGCRELADIAQFVPKNKIIHN
jgi:hypothetical protein